jgi:hypothetical protein
MPPPEKKQRLEEGQPSPSPNVNYLQVIEAVRNWDTIDMFAHPVNATEVPGYYDVVKRPTDLSTIEGKVRRSEFEAPEDFIDELYLMVTNALEFNDTGSSWWRHARGLRKELPKIFKRCGLKEAAADAFVPDGRAQDSERSLLKEEKKRSEKVSDTLKGMEEDMEIPLEELMAKYRGEEAKKKLAEVEKSEKRETAPESDSSCSDSDDGEEEEDEEEEDEEDDDDESSADS